MLLMASMFEEDQSRVGEYLETSRYAADGRRQDAIPGARQRLLGLAASFERLADQVEHWEKDGSCARLAETNNLSLAMAGRNAPDKIARDMVER